MPLYLSVPQLTNRSLSDDKCSGGGAWPDKDRSCSECQRDLQSIPIFVSGSEIKYIQLFLRLCLCGDNLEILSNYKVKAY